MSYDFTTDIVHVNLIIVSNEKIKEKCIGRKKGRFLLLNRLTCCGYIVT